MNLHDSGKKVTDTFCLKGPSGASAQKVPVTFFLRASDPDCSRRDLAATKEAGYQLSLINEFLQKPSRCYRLPAHGTRQAISEHADPGEDKARQGRNSLRATEV